MIQYYSTQKHTLTASYMIPGANNKLNPTITYYMYITKDHITMHTVLF